MGRYTLYRLEVIKARFVRSNPKDINNLFAFIEGQLADSAWQDRESKFTVTLDKKLFDKLKANVGAIKPVELETILNFTEERIEICRTSDKAEKIIGDLQKEEFYFREERYTELEKYIFKLTFG